MSKEDSRMDKFAKQGLWLSGTVIGRKSETVGDKHLEKTTYRVLVKDSVYTLIWWDKHELMGLETKFTVPVKVNTWVNKNQQVSYQFQYTEDEALDRIGNLPQMNHQKAA